MKARTGFSEEKLQDDLRKRNNRFSPAGVLAALAKDKPDSGPRFHFLSSQWGGLAFENSTRIKDLRFPHGVITNSVIALVFWTSVK